MIAPEEVMARHYFLESLHQPYVTFGIRLTMVVLALAAAGLYIRYCRG